MIDVGKIFILSYTVPSDGEIEVHYPGDTGFKKRLDIIKDCCCNNLFYCDDISCEKLLDKNICLFYYI